MARKKKEQQKSGDYISNSTCDDDAIFENDRDQQEMFGDQDYFDDDTGRDRSHTSDCMVELAIKIHPNDKARATQHTLLKKEDVPADQVWDFLVRSLCAWKDNADVIDSLLRLPDARYSEATRTRRAVQVALKRLAELKLAQSKRTAAAPPLKTEEPKQEPIVVLVPVAAEPAPEKPARPQLVRVDWHGNHPDPDGTEAEKYRNAEGCEIVSSSPGIESVNNPQEPDPGEGFIKVPHPEDAVEEELTVDDSPEPF